MEEKFYGVVGYNSEFILFQWNFFLFIFFFLLIGFLAAFCYLLLKYFRFRRLIAEQERGLTAMILSEAGVTGIYLHIEHILEKEKYNSLEALLSTLDLSAEEKDIFLGSYYREEPIETSLLQKVGNSLGY